MQKVCRVVTLPTNQKAVIGEKALIYVNSPLNPYWGYDKVIYAEGVNVECVENHLYVLSDDKIEVGDYYINIYNSPNHRQVNTHQTIKQLNNHKKDYRFKYCEKVIASTDPTLNLPTISEQFIQDWCKNPVEDVLVEYIKWHDLRTQDETKEFEYAPLVRNNQISIQVEKTDREKAIAWWNSLSFDQKNHAIKLARMIDVNDSLIDYSSDSLYWTGRTVQQLHQTLKKQLCK